MTARDDGGPAFPRSDYDNSNAGITLRDWFAGQALAQMAKTNPSLPGDKATTWPEPEELAERRARWAYLQADAMLSARKGGAA